MYVAGRMRNYLHLLLIAAIACSGCTEDPQTRSADSGGSSSNAPGAVGRPSGAFATQCGTVVGGLLVNPASPEDGVRGRVSVLGPNLLSLTLASGPILVKLHGLAAISDRQVAAAAQKTLQGLAAEGDAIFIPADAACTTTVSGGGVGAIGQVFTTSGRSYSEAVISRAQSRVSSDPCGGSLLSTCYRALEEEAQSKFAGELDRLLWKPVSDSDGNLAIHTGPFGTTVRVNGETGRNQGPGNGYGSLARFPKPGCAYGSSVKVEVFAQNGAAYSFNGSSTITIPTGCNRHCLEGGTLEQCVKR